jgi:hypothetical protein
MTLRLLVLALHYIHCEVTVGVVGNNSSFWSTYKVPGTLLSSCHALILLDMTILYVGSVIIASIFQMRKPSQVVSLKSNGYQVARLGF